MDTDTEKDRKHGYGEDSGRMGDTKRLKMDTPIDTSYQGHTEVTPPYTSKKDGDDWTDTKERIAATVEKIIAGAKRYTAFTTQQVLVAEDLVDTLKTRTPRSPDKIKTPRNPDMTKSRRAPEPVSWALEDADDTGNENHNVTTVVEPEETQLAEALLYTGNSNNDTGGTANNGAVEVGVDQVAIENGTPDATVSTKGNTEYKEEHQPRPDGPQPKVWAEVRQDLCSALPYFKSYNGGTYFKDGYVRGQLLDGEVRGRDIIGAQVIVSTCPGTREQRNGRYCLALTPSPWVEKAITRFRNTMRDKIPIFIILGSQHRFFPQVKAQAPSALDYHSAKSTSPAPHAYNVMGWYLITDLHQEKWRINEGDEIASSWVVRYEKLQGGETSWWYPEERTPEDRTGYAMPGDVTPDRAQCHTCNLLSNQVFELSWTCMNYRCAMYFQFQDPSIDVDTLTYATKWLRSRAKQPHMVLEPLMPLLPETEYSDSSQYGTEVTFRQGMVCPMCGCCADRLYWDRWECPNPSCKYIRRASIRVVPQKMADEENSKYLPYRAMQPKKANTIVSIKMAIGGYQTVTYLLPAVDGSGKIVGTVTHFQASADINERQDGGNDLYTALQLPHQSVSAMRRWPVTCSGSSKEVRTRHFTANWGAPYKYAVRQRSQPFSEAPDAVLKATMRMTWAGQAVAGLFDTFLADHERHEDCPTNTFTAFNELLQVAYMEKDAMGYHDDGEKELGDTIVTLALGSPAAFFFAPKEPRKAPASKKAQSSKAPQKGGRAHTRPSHAVLKLNMLHGDMILMHGSAIHGHYLHKAESLGMRRFAMTCRYVDPSRIKDDSDRNAAIEEGKLPQHASNFNYDGF